ncbi:MAG: tetratricopeptide repeat protein, partial [Nannocystaceae bacterium]|nr:tetratricopeptide repeat protein [Nannocystaceae bacterium]
LGAFVGEWVDGHTDACVATNIRGEQSSELMDRRMLCLDRARREFEALLDVLETQTSDIVDYADDVLDGLPDLDVCAAPDQLDAYQRPPASAQKAAVERARALVAKSEALRRAGRSVLSLEKAEEAEAAVSGLEYDPIEAEVQLALGRALEDAGKPVEAARALGAAVEAATRSGLNRVRRNALAARYTVEAEQGHFDAADVLEPGVIGGSKSPTDVADVKVRRAGALVLRGQAAKATEEFRAALSILEPLADPLAIARARRGLATSLVGQARFAEAEVEARRVIEILAEHLGSQHPRGAGAYGTLADILRQAGRYDDAEVEARRALAQTEAVRQGGHPDIAAARRTLGSLLWSAGKYDDALEALRTSAEETEAAYGPNHIATASAYNNLAGPLSSLGRIDDALVALRKALNIKQSTLGENHPSTARTRDNVAGLLREQGKFDEAELEHRAAMQARIAAFGSIHPEVAISHSSLGTLFQFQGKLEQAEMAYAKAVHIATESEGPDHPDVAHYQVNQANMLVVLGQLEVAIVLLRKAVATRTAKLAPGTARLLDSHNALGRALCRSGQRTEGRAQLETSLATPLSGSVILQVRYEAAFELAKCAWDDHDRTRSDAAVASAREWADKDGPTAAAFTKGVEAWVASRR